MNFWPGGISLLIRCGVAIFLLAWGGMVLWSQLEWENWREGFNKTQDVTEFLENIDDTPRRSAAYRLLAFASVNQVFPRRWDSTLGTTEAWLDLQPFSAEPWVFQGQALFMTGNREQGLASLEYAANLAPGFPASRLQAVPVWVMAGERETATSLARDVASLDDLAAMEVAGILQSSGFPADEVWIYSRGNDLPPEKAARLLRTIHRSSPNAQQRIFDAFSEELLDQADFRDLIVKEFMAPATTGALKNLWHRHHGESVVEASTSTTRMLLATPDTPTKPRDGFLLGWQDPPGRIARSSSISLEDGRNGWRVSYRESTNQRHWVLHRAVLLENSGPFKMTLKIQQHGIGNQAFRLILNTPDGEFNGPWTSPTTHGVNDLVSRVPASITPGLIEVRLQNRGTAPYQPAPEFDVISIRLEELSVEAPN